MKNLIITSILVGTLGFTVLAQENNPKEKVYKTFNDTRIININSVEVLKKKQLDVRITHRFGDMAATGAAHTFYGMETASDIRIAFEYGLTDKLTLSLGRLKGLGDLKELIETSGKYKLVEQTKDNSNPVTVTLLANSTLTAQLASADKTSGTSFSGFADRLTYLTQVLIARKFSERLSVQVTPTLLHRNYVAFIDKNDLFAVGLGVRYQVSKNSGLFFEYMGVADETRLKSNTYHNPIAIGYEVGTGGHTFQINLTNSRGIIENQFISENTADFTKGEFRIGFTISRIFGL